MTVHSSSAAIARGYVPSRFGQLHFRESGTRDTRPTLLLLHQNPSSSLEYERLIAELARDRHVVAFDTPGYGMSDCPPEPLSVAGYAACFADAARTMGLFEDGGCDVFGVHTGSLLAFELALAEPHGVRRVVVSGVPMRTPAERAERLAASRTTPPIAEDGAATFDMAAKLWKFIVSDRLPGVPLRRAAQLWIDKLAPLDRQSWAYQGVWGYEYTRLPHVTQPVLLLQPDEAIADVSRQAAALLPDHRIVDLDGFSRDLFELPEAVARLALEMRRFLDTEFL